jgi:2,3-dihydroxy-p-cumate/2,3-dihydroxybenzoate 3,4-dioxygenase
MTAEVRIVAVAYVRIASAEPQAAARFAAEILGLEPVAGADGDIALRSDSRYRTLSLVAAPHRPSIGIEVWDDAALAAAEAALAAAGFAARRASPEECRVRYAMAAVLAQDGSGNAIDLVVRPMQSGRRYFPSRDAGITGLHDVALRSTAIARDRAFWTALGARISGYVGEITYLAIDDCHHRIALHPATRAGPLYAAFEVRIVQGPGRQPASGQIFLHVEGPDGMIYSYVHGMDRAPPHGRPPRQYPLEAESLCAWGSESQGVPELAAEGGA